MYIYIYIYLCVYIVCIMCTYTHIYIFPPPLRGGWRGVKTEIFHFRGGSPCYGRLAFIWRIEYIQDLPGAARRLLDSERYEGVPVSSFQELVSA